ncbi:hypothetical protein V6N12_042996 [Hibiscus sabdariffa]|uniref:Uncharacterized protein n=1 Tax=Hibiscus sabdariffa TaxID=183260 RepID=A0ABR2DHY2_9ROSI
MKSSGFGGLGVEGMVGMDVPVVGTIPPGDGNKGATSGDSGRKGDNEGSEMVGGEMMESLKRGRLRVSEVGPICYVANDDGSVVSKSSLALAMAM